MHGETLIFPNNVCWKSSTSIEKYLRKSTLGDAIEELIPGSIIDQ